MARGEVRLRGRKLLQSHGSGADGGRPATSPDVGPALPSPPGAVLTEAAREALLARSAESGVWLVEDNPYGELRYGGRVQRSMLEMSAEPGSAAYAGLGGVAG